VTPARRCAAAQESVRRAVSLAGRIGTPPWMFLLPNVLIPQVRVLPDELAHELNALGVIEN
jgi:hypothetical protein